MRHKLRRLTGSLSFKIIGATATLLILFSLIVSTIGYAGFVNAFKKEYDTTTYHVADTATTLVEGDHLDAYLAGETTAEYRQTKMWLDAYCKSMGLSLIYVIQVDQSDYGRFVSIFNSVDNSVDNSEYTEWELGYRRETTNEEYAEKYRAIYAQESTHETVYRPRPTDGQHPHITTMVPVKTSSGEVAAILCVQRPIREIDELRAPYRRNIVLTGMALSLLAAGFAMLYLKKQFVAPVRRISAEAMRFASENTQGKPLNVHSTSDEISDLAACINTMEQDMMRHIENLTAATAEREHIKAELKLASTIQESAIPNTFPAFPERTDLDIYGSMTPAKEVGGDFYNYFLQDDDHLVLMIGDVSGKGVPAALFMMVTSILLKDQLRLGGSPAQALRFVNDDLCEHNQADMFVTLWLGVLELSTGRLTFVNAGHEDAMLCRQGEAASVLLSKHHFVVGTMPNVPYRDCEAQLEVGEKLFLFTDGVTEATDTENRMFTRERLVDALNACCDRSPQEILETVHMRVDAFTGSAPQFDDLTMLCVERKVQDGPAKIPDSSRK